MGNKHPTDGPPPPSSHGKLRKTGYILADVADAWLEELEQRTPTPVEAAFAKRLSLFLKDERAAEIEAVLAALRATRGSRTQAAMRLGIAARTFYNILALPGVAERAASIPIVD